MKRNLYRYRNNLNDWFELRTSERKGSIALSISILLMIGYNFSAAYIFKSDSLDNTSLIEETRAWMVDTLRENKGNEANFASLLLEENNDQIGELFRFDPNEVTIAEWKRLGFTERQYASLKKYLEKGGIFRVKSDFSKMYFVNPEKFEELLPYLDLPESLSSHDSKQGYESRSTYQQSKEEPEAFKKQRDTHFIVEINSADTTELKKVRGIGSYTARKIIQFREHLGGFTSVEQLAEVYPLNAEKLDSMRTNLTVDIGLMKRININEASTEQLSKHPYLSNAQAKSLIAYRNMHGNFKQIDDIKKSVLIDQKTFDKVKDYLRVN